MHDFDIKMATGLLIFDEHINFVLNKKNFSLKKSFLFILFILFFDFEFHP